MSIDRKGGLRIRPLRRAGWGRAGVVYGPAERTPGLALSVLILNGHNTSQSESQGLAEALGTRLRRWLIGSESVRVRYRIFRWLRSGRVARTFRQFRWWATLASARSNAIEQDDNLTVGWFAEPAPRNPVEHSAAFVMRATGPDNGELMITIGGVPVPVIRGVQNLPICYVVVLRGTGAAYYAGSLAGAHGLATLPAMRPLGIDPATSIQSVYAGFQQAVLGQIGFRADTRVYGVIADRIDDLATWYGTAHVADAPPEGIVHDGRQAEVGGAWEMVPSVGPGGERAYLIQAPSTSGLLHARWPRADGGGPLAGLIWRWVDSSNYWCLLLDGDTWSISIREAARWSRIANGRAALTEDSRHSLQILDDGAHLTFILDSTVLIPGGLDDSRLASGVGAGCLSSGSDLRIDLFEVHPRSIDIPEPIRLDPPSLPKGTRVVLADDFRGRAHDLDGRVLPTGGRSWRREIGRGRFSLDGDGELRVVATREQPNPGRTAYLLDWDSDDFVDLSAEMTLPGTGPNESDHGSSGFIIWQDQDNYLIVNPWLDPYYAGASVSSFFMIDGFEDVYDAIWTNVGKRIYYGKRINLRLISDGVQYLVLVDDEPVLFRSIRDVYESFNRLRIRAVGLVANWEWGNDTGTIFHRFEARR